MKLKASVGRAFQRDITELYPSMEPYIESLISKKAEVVEARWCVGCAVEFGGGGSGSGTEGGWCACLVLLDPLLFCRAQSFVWCTVLCCAPWRYQQGPCKHHHL